MTAAVASVSGWDWVSQSRLRSKPLPFARWFAILPSGFWATFQMRSR
jgi:hypothetical protein